MANSTIAPVPVARQTKLWTWLLTLFSTFFFLLTTNLIIESSIGIRIIAATLCIGCAWIIIFLKNRDFQSKIEQGVLKAYGKKTFLFPIPLASSYLAFLLLGLGLLFVLLSKDLEPFLWPLVLGGIWITQIFDSRNRFYLIISDQTIYKSNLIRIKRKNIESVEILPEKVVIITHKRNMEISFAGLKTNEWQQLVDDFKIHLK